MPAANAPTPGRMIRSAPSRSAGVWAMRCCAPICLSVLETLLRLATPESTTAIIVFVLSLSDIPYDSCLLLAKCDLDVNRLSIAADGQRDRVAGLMRFFQGHQQVVLGRNGFAV